jgi:hypothetical protein
MEIRDRINARIDVLNRDIKRINVFLYECKNIKRTTYQALLDDFEVLWRERTELEKILFPIPGYKDICPVCHGSESMGAAGCTSCGGGTTRSDSANQ